MNKKEFISELAEIKSITKKEAEALLEEIKGIFSKGLAEDGKVDIVGFLKAEVKDVPAKSGKTKIPQGDRKGEIVEWTTEATQTIKSTVKDAFIKDVIK
jgi:nucleoid DNA-binding protein